MEERLLNQQARASNETPCISGHPASDFHADVAYYPADELQRTQYAGRDARREAPGPTIHSPPSENHSINLLDGLALDSPGAFLGQWGNSEFHDTDATVDATRIPQPLLEVLVDTFYSSFHSIFPIIQRWDFQRQYDRWLFVRQTGVDTSSNEDDGAFSFLLYALLSVAASAIPVDHTVFDHPGVQAYRRVNLSHMLYSHAARHSQGILCQLSGAHGINFVMAQALISLYLIRVGNVSNAWVIAGQAIRLYQGLDIDDSVSAAPDLGEVWSPRGNVWWCLCILDCCLSTALSRPLAIDDADSDPVTSDESDFPELGLEAKTDRWFAVIANFHIIISRIYRSIRRIRKSELAKNAKMWDALRLCIRKYDNELENCYTRHVLPNIEETSEEHRPLALQTIAVASYYVGLVLLYRTCIERFCSSEPETFLRCAEAASNCIKATPQIIANVPTSYFVIQQSRAVYESTKVLLHCMRRARNVKFTRKAWRDVETGFEMLHRIKIQWPQIQKYQRLTEEDMRQTQIDFNRNEQFHGIFDRYGQTGTVEQVNSPRGDHTTQGSHPFEERSKRRKLSQSSFRSGSVSAASSAPGALPLPNDSDGYANMGQTLSTTDFLIPDLPSLSSPSGSLPANFGDAMFMSSVDQTVS